MGWASRLREALRARFRAARILSVNRRRGSSGRMGIPKTSGEGVEV